MLDKITQSLLLFSDDLFIIPLLIIGFIALDRATFYHAVCLTLLSILVNVSLKVSFQIPLSPSLGKKGYAFPSGHMQLATVLYTWLAFKMQKFWFSMIIGALLIGIGLSLVHFGYHNYYDVVAGVFFAILLLVSYYLVSLKWPQTMPWVILSVANLMVIYIYIRTAELPNHVWMAYYGLWGFIVAEQIASKRLVLTLRSPKIVAILFCFLAILTIHALFAYLLPFNQFAPFYELQWLFIGFIIPCANFCATKLTVHCRLSRVRK